MSYWLTIFILTIGLLLQATITTLPLVLCLLLVWYILKKDPLVFFLAFVFGILVDLMLVRDIGFSSIFFMVFLFVVFLYERKFEVETPLFVFSSSFLGSSAYLWLSGHGNIILQSFILSICSSLFFVVIQRFSIAGYKEKNLVSM